MSGGTRPGAGRKPRAGVAADERVEVKMTSEERERLESVLGKDETLSGFLREAGLERARQRIG